jgi:acyl-CoA thioesterase-1
MRTKIPSVLRYRPGAGLVNKAALAVLLFLLLIPGARAAEDEFRILALGDSLTAGYGLPREESFPARLEMALRDAGIKATVDNAGVSGDTSAGGLARVDWALAEMPDAAIVELGANDGLRGLDPAVTKANIKAVIRRLKDADVRVLLIGMKAPPNLGPEYVEAFDGLFPALAKEEAVEFYPFFLDGVITDPSLNQGDQMHPNAKGVDVIVEKLLPYVKRLVQAEGSKG